VVEGTHHMKKEIRLVKKVKRLLRRLGCPRWLHHYGPKTYEFLEHLQALLIRAFCRLSYVRVKELFDLLGIRCPSKSALQYTAAKLSSQFWNKILKVTCGNSYLVAVDSTGLSRTNPSYYYLKRIDGKMPKIPIKLSMAFDTRKKKFCSARIRVLPSHDLKDVKHLIMHSEPKIIVADKAYDADWLHEYCLNRNIKAHIPMRNKGKPHNKRHTARRKAAEYFNLRTYHRRELVESGNSSIKRKYGSSVSSKTVRTIRTEVYARLVCHNLFFWIIGLLGQSPSNNSVNFK